MPSPQLELLSCLSSLVEQLPALPPSDLELCLSVATRLVGSYLNLWAVQRTKVNGALVRLLLRMEGKGHALEVAVQVRD